MMRLTVGLSFVLESFSSKLKLNSNLVVIQLRMLYVIQI